MHTVRIGVDELLRGVRGEEVEAWTGVVGKTMSNT
jgi:hypothetical protein